MVWIFCLMLAVPTEKRELSCLIIGIVGGAGVLRSGFAARTDGAGWALRRPGGVAGSPFSLTEWVGVLCSIAKSSASTDGQSKF